MSKKLFGYKRKQVDIYIDELARSQKVQLEELNSEISGQASEKERLLGELDSLQVMLQSRGDYAQIVEEADARLEKAVNAIDESNREEISGILDRHKALMDNYEEKLNYLKNEVNSSRNNITSIFKMTRKLLKIESSSTGDVVEKAPSIKHYGKVIEYSGFFQNVEVPIENTENENKAEGMHNEVITDEVPSESLAQGQEVDMYDGVSSVYGETPNTISAVIEETTIGFPDNSFWDDEKFDQRTDDSGDINHGAEIAVTEEVEDSGLGFGQEEFFEPVSDSTSEVSFSADEVKHVDNYEAKAGFETQTGDKKPDMEKNGFEAGEAANSISPQEIDMIKKRYIIGKIAGEDLYANDGRIIVGKGKPITSEIVERAEMEGKLAELIMNMLLPGLG